MRYNQQTDGYGHFYNYERTYKRSVIFIAYSYLTHQINEELNIYQNQPFLCVCVLLHAIPITKYFSKIFALIQEKCYCHKITNYMHYD